MIREYGFQKKVTEEQAASVLAECKELEGLQKLCFTEDGKAIQVTAENEDYERLMERILNIFSRCTNGQWISFTKFVPEEN